MWPEYESRLTIQYNVHKGEGSWYVYDKQERPRFGQRDGDDGTTHHWSGEEAHEYIFDTFEEVIIWVNECWKPAQWKEDNE